MKSFVLHPETPNKREIQQIVSLLKEGAIGILPTDSAYAIVSLMSNKEGIERLIRVTGKTEKKAKLSLLCLDLKAVAAHTLPYDNHIFKAMKRYLPGPYTFILNANNTVTKYFKQNKKEIGIRIPNNQIVLGILGYLGEPLISTTATMGEADSENPNFEDLETHYNHNVDFTVDGQMESMGVTTILDCTNNEILMVREGLGKVD